MSTIKSSAENLTLNADGANNDIKFQSNGTEVASIDQAGLLSAGGVIADGAVNSTYFTGGSSSVAGRQLTLSSEDGTGGNDNATHRLTVPSGYGSFATSVGGSERMRIDSSGKVGIGTSSPASSLEVTGTVTSNKFTLKYAGTDTFATIEGPNNRSLRFDLKDNGTSDIFEFRNAAADSLLKIDNTGHLTPLGGVYLGGTAAANKLDDYEEGTWTPAWNTGSNGRSISGTGGYTKVGNLVTVYGFFEIGGSNNTGSGDVSFSGLPFTSANVSAQRSAICIHVNKCASAVDGYISGFVYHNSQNFYVREGGIVADGSDLGNHFDQDTDFYISASYRV